MVGADVAELECLRESPRDDRHGHRHPGPSTTSAMARHALPQNAPAGTFAIVSIDAPALMVTGASGLADVTEAARLAEHRMRRGWRGLDDEHPAKIAARVRAGIARARIPARVARCDRDRHLGRREVRAAAHARVLRAGRRRRAGGEVDDALRAIKRIYLELLGDQLRVLQAAGWKLRGDLHHSSTALLRGLLLEWLEVQA